jgi:hypothetical protein
MDMELKNALSVCLIALFSATLVVLIARALDSQAAARLEPQLARIATELEGLRSAGGLAAAAAAVPPHQSLRDGLLVYYFHGNKRCPTCRAIEAQSFETIQTEFAASLDRGELVWETLNYDDPSGKDLAKTFDIEAAVVVLAQMKDGAVAKWKRLDEVWGLVGDKPAFAQLIRDEVTRMLPPAVPQVHSSPTHDVSDIPVPGEGNEDVPLPADAATDSPAK